MNLDNVYSIAVLVLAILLAGRYLLTSRRRSVAKLGASPAQVRHILPFGFDILWEAIKVVRLLKIVMT